MVALLKHSIEYSARQPESLHRRIVAHVFDISHSPPLSSEGPNLAPRALSPKWTPLHLPCASWLEVYIGLCYQLAFALDSQSIVALKAQASTFFSAGRTLQVMNALPSRPRPLPPRPHWTEPVSRDADSHLLEGQHHDFESWID